MRIVEPARHRTEEIATPCHSRKAAIQVAIPREEGFSTEQHRCPVCQKAWAVAIEVATEPPLAPDEKPRRQRSIWMREGKLEGNETAGRCNRSSVAGWFPVDHVNINLKSNELSRRRKDEFQRIEEAKLLGVHLLACSECGELSDLDASRWQMHVGSDEQIYAFCPVCSSLEFSP